MIIAELPAYAKEHSITITFSKGNLEESKTFSFKTVAEVEAFRDGVWEMFGNDDYTVEGEDNEDDT